MFNTTFFKFLVTFAVILGTSFLIMGITGGLDTKTNVDKSTDPAALIDIS